jgi:NADH-quinone oxidoreductase subunit M
MTPVLAASSPGFPILTAMVLTPVVGALVVAAISRRRPEVTRQLAVVFAAVTGALSVAVLAMFDSAESGFQLVEQATWITTPEVAWKLGVDGISLWLVVLTGLLFPLAMIAAPPTTDHKAFYVWMLLLQAGCLGGFLAMDLLLFYVMFEIVLVPIYFLISRWGYENRKYAATKMFLFTMLGSIFMLVATIATAYLAADGGQVTFDLVTLAENQGALAVDTARWLFCGFAIAFAVKVPIFPLHTWLPDAHTQAPTAGSVVLAAVMLKLGTYGFLRFGLYLFPEPSVWAAPVIVTLGVVGITYGAICAAMQRDLKRLIAYSSVAHLGFIALGTFAFTTQALQGSIFQMVAHGISTGALFLLVGMIYQRRHTREIAELRGLQKPAPILAGVFTVVMLSSIGLPGLNGFVGEFLILQGSFLTRRWWAVVAVLGVILASVYLLWAYQRVFHGEPDEANAKIRDLSFTEGLVMVPLIAAIVVMGVYPKPIFERMEPSVDRLVGHLETHTDFRQPDVATEGPAIIPESERRQPDVHHDDGDHEAAADDHDDPESEGGQ